MESNLYVTVEDGFFVLKNPANLVFEYNIHSSTCNTKKKLDNWIEHLREKNWVTEYHISGLCGAFSKQNLMCEQ